MRTRGICSIEGCGKPHKARGWCRGHYRRFCRHGTPTAGNRSTMNGEPMAWLLRQMEYDGNNCVWWPYAAGNGYGVVKVGEKYRPAPNYLCELAHGKPPTPEHETAHSCGRGQFGCMTKRHLRWATPAENSSDRILHGTDNRGSKNSMVKLSESEVLEVKDLLEHKAMKQNAIASAYGVCKQTITLIKQEKRWEWLTRSHISAPSEAPRGFPETP